MHNYKIATAHSFTLSFSFSKEGELFFMPFLDSSKWKDTMLKNRIHKENQAIKFLWQSGIRYKNGKEHPCL